MKQSKAKLLLFLCMVILSVPAYARIDSPLGSILTTLKSWTSVDIGSTREIYFNSGGGLAADANLAFTTGFGLEVGGTIDGNLEISSAKLEALYTMTADDCGDVLYFNSSSAQTLAVSVDATTALDAGCNMAWGMMGGAILTVSAGSGFTFANGNMTYSSANNLVGSLIRFAADIIALQGGTAP